MAEEDSFWQYTQILINGEDRDKKRDEIAELCGVTAKTLYQWDKKKIDWDFINKERRKRYGSKISDVDEAMFKAAQKGDVAAAKLVYERFDGYTPTVASLNLTNKTDDELAERAKSILAKYLTKPTGQDSTGSDSLGRSEASA